MPSLINLLLRISFEKGFKRVDFHFSPLIGTDHDHQIPLISTEVISSCFYIVLPEDCIRLGQSEWRNLHV